MTDEELIARLRAFGHVDAYQAADRIEQLSAQLKMVLEREAETHQRHEAREDTVREAALREAWKAVNKVFSGFPNHASDAVFALIGEKK